MAKSWFIEANKSQDPEVKDLLKQYNELDANADDYAEKKAELVATIKAKLESSVKPETPEVKAEMDKVADEVVAAENANTDSIDAELDSKDEPETPESSENAENAQIEDSADLDEAKPESEEIPSFTYTPFFSFNSYTFSRFA